MTAEHPDPSARQVPWTRFDFLMAASLKDATGAPEAPLSLYKPVPWRRTVAALTGAVLSLGLGVWFFFAWVYPPQLVREAMVHEHREATLRGDFQKNKLPMLHAMGLREGASLPGLVQLQRHCEIAGRKAYHLTTFIEKGGGMVTILAFEQPVPGAPSGHGVWMGRYWRFVEGVPGRTILMLADNPKVLTETERFLKKG